MKKEKEKDPNAVAMGKKRWEGKTEKEKKAVGKFLTEARMKKHLTKPKKNDKI